MNEMGGAVEIAIETDSQELAAALEQLSSEGDVLTSKREGLDGVTLTTVILTLTPIIVGQICRLLRASIEARKHVRVLYDGIVVEGVSEEKLLKMLEKSRRK